MKYSKLAFLYFIDTSCGLPRKAAIFSLLRIPKMSKKSGLMRCDLLSVIQC